MSYLVRGLLLALVFGCFGWGQGMEGVISGIITSPKAAIPAATVSVTNTDTGVIAWSGKTNVDGVYRAPDLPAGRYNIDVTAEGFKHQYVSGIELSVGQLADIVIIMQAGIVADTVTVEGGTAGQLASDSSSLSTSITPSQLQGLPLPSRYTLNLLALTPGVSSGGDITSQGGLGSSQLSIDGSRTLNGEFLIDGVSVVSGSTGAPQSLPPSDS
ncbi:MAG: carboxypeptidase-like regulatory domain-containing protein, partial [Bryobacteraceae bacterium]